MPANGTILSPGTAPAAKMASPAERLPGWYPAWARELAELYFSGTICLFILHGNVHDLVHCPEGERGRLLQPGGVSHHAGLRHLGPGVGL